MRFAIGDVAVDVVVDDDRFELPLRGFLPGLDLAAPESHRGPLEPEFRDLGRDVEPAVRHGLPRPAAAGRVEPAAVAAVLCTHPHLDHVGWNTRREDGRGRRPSPTPATWSAAPSLPTGWPGSTRARRRRSIHARALRDSVLPLVEAGLVDPVDDGRASRRPGWPSRPCPATPRARWVADRPARRGRAVFCGDAVHGPAQIPQPGVPTPSCADPRLAAATRRAVLAEATPTRRLVVPARFRGRRRAHVREAGGGFAPVFPDGPGQVRPHPPRGRRRARSLEAVMD